MILLNDIPLADDNLCYGEIEWVHLAKHDIVFKARRSRIKRGRLHIDWANSIQEWQKRRGDIDCGARSRYRYKEVWGSKHVTPVASN